MQGKVKFYNRNRGWGYIIGQDGKDYFVHHSQIQMEGYKIIYQNQVVEFKPFIDRKSQDQAGDVRII